MPGLASASSGTAQAGQSAEPPNETYHVVQRGETLFSIAQRYGSTVNALAHANGLHDPASIYVGQRLKIPGGGVGIDPQATMSYVVQAGDSLIGIARRYATPWRGLARLNLLISPDVLHAGQVIRVPSAGQAGGPEGGLHVVGDGETLFQIALRYDVPPWSVASASDLAHPALLYPGQTLLVPADGLGRLPAPFETVDVRPLPVSQGRTVVATVRTAKPVTLTGRVFERAVPFAEEKGVYYGLIGVHAFTEPGLYEMALQASENDGRMTEITVDVVVEAEPFSYERIQTSPSLLDPAVVAKERERLNALRPTFSNERSWSERFERPCGGTISSYFGTRRAYNDGPYTSYHGGVDFRGATGTPVYAPVGGTVVLADPLTVRGNGVMLDHGWGVLTGYWHLSSIEVEVGQRVEQGDLIARIGNTGLSTGSHLHWEMWVGGVNVNPLQWLDPFYPWPQGGEDADHGDVE
jgi:murein DD-endopeptidase MepM/ murein hydrolase activator NlpD